MVLWLRICLAMQGTWVWSRAGRLRSNIGWGNEAWASQLLAWGPQVRRLEAAKKPTKAKGDFPVVRWLGLCASTSAGAGSIPGWGTKIPCAMWRGQNNNETKKYVKVNKTFPSFLFLPVSVLLSPAFHSLPNILDWCILAASRPTHVCSFWNLASVPTILLSIVLWKVTEALVCQIQWPFLCSNS